MEKEKYTLAPHPRDGYLQVKPTPSAEEIARFYAEEFYSSAYPRLNNSSLEVQLEDQEYNDGRREDMCATIEELLGRPLNGLKVLDVGCGWGQALLHLQKKGMICKGFDPAPEAVAYGKEQGLDLVVAGLDNMDLFHERFDVVMFLNVLEHMADPEKAIQEVREKVLKPGGVLVVFVPNDFNAFQIAARKIHNLSEWWVAPPAHLNYFTKPTLANLLTNSGFKVQLTETSFPMEMFLLQNRNYVGNPAVGKACHKERVAFELNLRKTGQTQALRDFYRALADAGLGREVCMYAVSE